MNKQRRAEQLNRKEDYIIGIEAATPAGGIALATVSGRLEAHLWRDSRQPVSRRMLTNLEQLFHEDTIEPGQIKAIAVSHGPGSFTGVRIGLALAKTLAHTWRTPLYTWSTLAMTAARWARPGEWVSVLLDARRNELYSGLYRLDERGWPRAVREDRVEPVEDALAELAVCEAPRIILSGDGAARHREAIAGRLGERAIWTSAALNGPGADALALAGARALSEGLPGVDPLGVEPVYLRQSDAERNRIQKAQDWCTV